MILFAEDWAKYPTAFPDMTTRNRTFVRLATVYREMGIKNHTFMLALVNPELQGVDPFATNLPIEVKVAIGVECQINPWYYFREIARAPNEGSNDSSIVEANRGNIALWWLFFNHVMTILIQIRQTGKSFSTDSLMAWLMNIRCQNTAIELLTKDDDLRRKNIKRIKEILDELPPYLLMRNRDDVNNTEQITIQALGNTYNTHVPQASPKRALNMGRGLKTSIFQIDEAPFQINISLALPAALAATGAAMDEAKKNGAPYGIILTTTAGKKDDKDGAFVYRIVEDAAPWSEKLLDARNQEHLYEMLKHNSRGGIVRANITLNHRQLGKNDEWLRDKIATSLQTGEEADRDFFNRWTSGTQSNPLDTATLERISNSELDIIHTQIDPINSYIVNWYIPEEDIAHRMATGRFVIGSDPSEAGGGDDIAMVMTDVETLEVVCTGTYNETNLINFARWYASVLINYVNVTTIIERRSMGAMLIDYLLVILPAAGIDPFTRIFNFVVQDANESPERFREIKTPMHRRPASIYDRHKTTFGFATSGGLGATSRSLLYSVTLQLAAKRAGDKVYDRKLINQIKGLITKNGRVNHQPGEHDDLVIAWLLTHWFITQGKNLSYYGIDPSLLNSATAVSSKNETDDQFYQRQEQGALRDRIMEIHDMIAAEDDHFIIQRLEHELRALDRRIILEQGEIYSVDALLQSARESKKQKRGNFRVIDDYASPYAKYQNQSAGDSFEISNQPLQSTTWRHH